MDLRFYAKRSAEDPEFNTKRWQQRKQAMMEDGTWEAYQARDRQYRAQYRADPAKAELLRRQSAKQYEKRREEILRRRKERWSTLTTAEKRERIERARRRGREWRREWRKKLSEDPDQYQDYLAYQREKGRESYARKALRELLDVGEQLRNRNEPDNPD